MSSPDPQASDSGARILSFRPRHGAARTNQPVEGAPPEAVEDLSRYARDDAPDDYPHRMMVNGAAFAVLIVLAIAGYWLADTMASMRKNQDCVLSGRRNCAGVEIPARERY